MDIQWTPRASYPRYLYRVCHTHQHILFYHMFGFAASDLTSFHRFDTDIQAFIASLIAHREQEPVSTPYISFFEDENEAKEWCLALEASLQIKTFLVRLDLQSEAMRSGFDSGLLHCWRLKDVVSKLGLKDRVLMEGSGMGMADSEWMFWRLVPCTAEFSHLPSAELRFCKFLIL